MTEYEFKFVKFEPWVREGYSSKKPRLLILGESHYNCKDHPGITTEVVEDHLSANPLPFFNRIVSVVGDQEIHGTNQQECFEKLAFYNYIQIVLPSANTKPKQDDFKKSEDAFREVLEELKPHKVVALGWRLYFGVKDFWSDGTLKWETIEASENRKKKMTIGYFVSGNRKFHTAFIEHPSSRRGFNVEEWRPQVQKFLKS